MSAFWNGRRVFVTGATGFLGSWLVRELRHRGALVVGLVRDLSAEPLLFDDALARPDFSVFGEVENFDRLLRALNDYEIETVFHLAAQPLVGIAFNEPRATFESNIRGTWNLLEACRQVTTVKRIVAASSDKAYGTAPRLPYDEEMPLQVRIPVILNGQSVRS
jgi:CDP-glucose 4,6-dehydratase